MPGSSWRSEPAAALRGFTKSRLALLARAVVELREVRAADEDLAAHLEHASGAPRPRASSASGITRWCGGSR